MKKLLIYYLIFCVFSTYLVESKMQNRPINDTIPLYLSIEAVTETSRALVYKFIQDSMERLLLSYPNDKDILDDYVDIFFKKGEKSFREPDSWHTTCLYIASNYSKLNSEIYQTFVEGVKYNLTSSTFVYVPGKIMTAPIFLENGSMVENEYPHISLLLSEYRAVDSNFVLKSIFDKNEYMKALYEKGLIKSKQFKLERMFTNVTINFEDKKVEEIVDTVYILKFGEVLNLKGVTKKNY